MIRKTRFAVTILAVIAPTLARADDAAPPAIVVTGQADTPVTATKVPTPIVDVPQAVAVVGRDQIDDRAIRSMAELVRLVPGAGAGAGEGHRDQIVLRGNSSTADFFIDGLRDDVQYYRSFYNIDRVEVLKGANAMIFGRGGGGGVINRVARTPDVGRTGGSATGFVDTHGDTGAMIDANLALAPALAARVDGFVESLANHRDGVTGTRWAVNPTVAAELGDGARVDIGYEHVSDNRTVDRGVPSRAGRPLGGVTHLLFADPDVNRSTFDADVVRARVRGDLAPDLTLDVQALWGDYDKVYANVVPATAATDRPDGTHQVGISGYRSTNDRTSRIVQTNLIWTPVTGAVRHTILFGGDASLQDTANLRGTAFFNGSTTATVVFGSTFTPPPTVFRQGVGVSGSTSNLTRLRQWSLYGQDQIAFGDHVEVLAGIRYDDLRIGALDRFSGVRTARADRLWSPRGALILKPGRAASLYASYGRSYLPQSGDQFGSLTPTNAALAPERFDTYEMGGKWQASPALLLTAAVYQLDRTNTRAAGPVPGVTVLTGRQRSAGVELSLNGRIADGWSLDAAAALTRARYRGGDFTGRHVPLVPARTANVWLRHDVSKPVSVAGGVSYQGKSFASTTNTVVLPAFARFDGAVLYRLSDSFEMQLNVENIMNHKYFALAQGDNNIAPGATRTLRFSVKTAF